MVETSIPGRNMHSSVGLNWICLRYYVYIFA